jgi:hypothetical protein
VDNNSSNVDEEIDLDGAFWNGIKLIW